MAANLAVMMPSAADSAQSLRPAETCFMQMVHMSSKNQPSAYLTTKGDGLSHLQNAGLWKGTSNEGGADAEKKLGTEYRLSPTLAGEDGDVSVRS